MSTQSMSKFTEKMPSLFDELLKPWSEWFDGGGIRGRMMHVPAVNIVEEKDAYQVTLAAPGMKKEDFNVDLDGNMLTISSEKEESREEDGKKFTRKEYSYSSFSRSFTVPEEIVKEKIEANYVDGVLKILLPRKESAKATTAKHIAIN